MHNAAPPFLIPIGVYYITGKIKKQLRRAAAGFFIAQNNLFCYNENVAGISVCKRRKGELAWAWRK